MRSYLKFFDECLQYRELTLALIFRHLNARYRGSALGLLWSLINPLFLMGVYTLVFTYYMRFDHVPNYTIFLFSGLLPWLWVVSSLVEGSTAISGSGHLVTKSLFPAHILPFVSVATSLVNFLLSLPLLYIFIWFAGIKLSLLNLLLLVLNLVPLLILNLTFLYGLSLIASSVNVFFRDVQHLAGNFITLIFFLTPIVYPLSSVPEGWRFTIIYNPLSRFVITYHEVLYHFKNIDVGNWLFLGSASLVSLFIGISIYLALYEKFPESL